MGILDTLLKPGREQSDGTETFTFAALPQSLAELQALPEASLDSPYKTAALAVAALCRYAEDADAVLEMLNFLKGPEDLSEMEKQFLRDRLAGKGYKPLSFFDGATPENGYTPRTPYRITVSANPHSFPEENWATLYVTSGGADSPRPIRLRKKPSTGQWFLNELQCLSDIRVPASQDPWA
ncbi:MAG: hypothetical protein E7425_00310 [Ruminococcaceae bacterium]|jgi:hypothetical protein|nr:hypothetical protein [Oscillospiraceae bacterium]